MWSALYVAWSKIRCLSVHTYDFLMIFMKGYGPCTRCSIYWYFERVQPLTFMTKNNTLPHVLRGCYLVISPLDYEIRDLERQRDELATEMEKIQIRGIPVKNHLLIRSKRFSREGILIIDSRYEKKKESPLLGANIFKAGGFLTLCIPQ